MSNFSFILIYNNVCEKPETYYKMLIKMLKHDNFYKYDRQGIFQISMQFFHVIKL